MFTGYPGREFEREDCGLRPSARTVRVPRQSLIGKPIGTEVTLLVRKKKNFNIFLTYEQSR
jgi:hypothetical protein